jgi:peptidoglycan/xylan/chitin deacetylase (PgdA/CDA1 family)
MNKSRFSIPVLMYHHVNPRGKFINVTPEKFEAHMRYLNRHGFTALHTDELLAILNGQKMPPKKPVMITFDDGWLDNWIFAFPALKKYGMKAVIFVITSLIPEKGRRQRSDEGEVAGFPKHTECERMIESGSASEVMISWEEIREMTETGLIEIQSHTHTHRRYDKLYTDPEERREVLMKELKTSKEIIEEKLDIPCNAICWPWGKYNSDYVKVAQSSGFGLMFTTEKGTNTETTEPWRIRRVVIGNIGGFNFRKKLFIYSRDYLSRAYLKYFHKK